MKWLKEVKEFSGKNTTIGLIGTKCDKKDLNSVTKAEIKDMIKKNDFEFYLETSAKNLKGVDDLIQVCIKNNLKLSKKPRKKSPLFGSISNTDDITEILE